MPQPADVDAAARELIDLFRAAQDDITAQLQALVGDDRAGRRRARLRELDQSITATLASLEADTRRWLETRFPGIYGLGGQDVAAQLGERFEWTQPHIAALQTLVGDVYDDVLAATRYVGAGAKRWVRDQARRQTGLSIVEGRTAQQAARVLVSEAGEVADVLGGPVGMVRYADGSYRRLADYADMLLRTTTARAFNTGSLNTMTQFGVGWVEVLDGSVCGWTSHDSGDKANGTIRSVEEAYRHPLSHPRCRRSFAARPDIRSDAAARRARTIRDEASLADQAQAERERAERFRRRRQARQARQPRSTPRRPSRARRRPSRTRPPVDPYVPQKSTRKVQEWMEQRWGTDQVGRRAIHFDGLKVDAANEYAATMHDLMTRFPQTAQRIRVFGTSAPVTRSLKASGLRIRNISPRAYADAVRGYSIRVSGSKAPQMKEMLERDVSIGFHPPGTDSIAGVVRHEFGHHVFWTAQERGGDEARLALEQVIEGVVGSDRNQPGYYRKRYEAIKADVSEYALKNNDELMAESFAYATSSDTASTLARGLFDALTRFAEG